ncbi:ankyrin repeat-containing domain protein [Xylariaceae sp. FL1651]|nr:ankyrin repeat-containing domain protein [Xylariaceae sp. FL1651]
MSRRSSVSSGHSSLESSLTVDRIREDEIKAEKESGNVPDATETALYVAWTPGPHNSPTAPPAGPNNVPKAPPVDIDVVVIFGLFDVPQAPHKPLTWLRTYLDRPGGYSRITHFKYHPSQVLAPGQSYYGIFSLANLLLDQLTRLRQGGPKKRQIIFLAFDIGCIIVKKALTIASKSLSPHCEIFDACRILAFFDCPHRSVDALDMEDKLARFLYGRAESPQSQIRPTIAALPGLAAAILETNESFIASKFLDRAFIVNIHEDAGLSYLADQMIERHTGILGTSHEHDLYCPRLENSFIPRLLHVFREYEGLITYMNKQSLNTHFPKLAFDAERALLSLTASTEPFSTAGHLGAPIKRSDTYMKWVDFWGAQLLYVYASKADSEVLQQTSEHVFFHISEVPISANRLGIRLYFSFNATDIRSQSLSSMLWTFLAEATSRFHEIRRYMPLFLDRLSDEQACTETDLLRWFEFFMCRFDYVCLVINNFDHCIESSRKAFLQHVSRVARKSEVHLKVLITSKSPALSEAEFSEWPSINLDTDLVTPDEGTEAKAEGRVRVQEIHPTLKSSLIPYQQLDVTRSLTVLEDIDPITRSILTKQQNRRNLTMRELLLEISHGPLNSYSTESVLDRVLRSIPNQKRARLLVAFLLFATRPLSTKEFATIMFIVSEIDDKKSAAPPWDLFDRFERERTSWFAGIATNKHTGVHLAHSHIAEILRSPQVPDSPRYFWHEVAITAHYDIVQLCLKYLSRSQVEEEQDMLSEKSFAVDSDLGFISYAVRFWPYHFSLAQENTQKEDIENLRQMITKINLKRWSRTSWLLANPFNRSRAPWKSPFAVLAGLGYPKILGPSSREDTASGLEEAARAGDAQLVNNLLEIEDLPPSALLAATMAASASGNESLTIELINRLSVGAQKELSGRGKTLLFRAARIGLDRLVEVLLKIGTPVDSEIPYCDDASTTPLCMASIVGSVSTVKVLLTYGADAEFKSYLQRTPVSLAASRGNSDVIECLAKKGLANIEHLSLNIMRGVLEQTPLFIACELGLPLAVEKLVELGVDPSQVDKSGWASIIVAAIFGRWRCVQALLNHGVDIDTAGPGGYGTPLPFALNNGHVEIVRRLLERGANPSTPLLRVPLLLEVADRRLPLSHKERLSLAKLLLDNKVDINATDESGMSPLLRACANADFELAECLLDFSNPDVNLTDKRGYTPLYEAARMKNTPLIKLLLDRGADANIRTSKELIALHMSSDSEEITRLLAERTKSIDLSNHEGITQLMLGASKGWTGPVKALIEHKADVNATVTGENQWTGWTAVSFAAYFHFADIITILAEAGADLRKPDANGASPLHLVLEGPRDPEDRELSCLDALMEFRTRIDLDLAGEDGETVLIRCAELGMLRAVQKLVRAGASLNRQDKFGSTALTYAVGADQREIVSYLLEQSADPNAAGKDYSHKEGPLLRACRRSNYTIAKMLIDYGADLNCDSVSGYGTPLMAVCLPYADHEEDTDKLTMYLLELDVDVNAKSRYVGSPLAAAALSSRPTVVRALLNKGAAYDVEDSMKRKAIHFAAINGEENFRIIEEAAGKISEVDILGRHVLHYASQGGRLKVVKRIFDILPDLNVDMRDIDGWTALCWVARGTTCWISEDRASEPTDPVGVVKFLLEQGADRFVHCKIGDKTWSPLQIAYYTGASDEVINLLKSGLESERGTQAKDAGNAEDGTNVSDQRKARVFEATTCDGCLWEIRGTHYWCKVCWDYALCPKCYPYRDLFHVFKSAHHYESAGPEFDEDSRASSTAPGNDDDDTSSVPPTSQATSTEDDDQSSLRSTTVDEDNDDDDNETGSSGVPESEY